jgi:tRNA (guanine37-N1)-methyltransferase
MGRIDVITIFPELFEPFLRTSIVGGAVRKQLVEIAVHDLRDWTTDQHRSVDDVPYGGGPGMVMKPEPLVAAIEALAGPKGPRRGSPEASEGGLSQGKAAERPRSEPEASEGGLPQGRVVLLSPQGRRLDQAGLERLAAQPHLVLVCGRYEGVDQRVIELAVDEELSIGDYVLSGGEVPAMAVIEGLVRLIPGAVGNPESTRTESFSAGLLEGPQYTRPPVFGGLAVPEVLRSGDHAAVAEWRARRARELSRCRRPDLPAAASEKDES